MIHEATVSNIADVQNIVYSTISHIYPKYYPKGVVEFFLNHHSKENIINDIREKKVYLISENGVHVGTGTIDDQNMNRVFVLPWHQGKGYGKQIMDFIETEIGKKYNTVWIDSSLPSFNIYVKRGYKLIEYKEVQTPSEGILFYSTMAKNITPKTLALFDINGKKFVGIKNSTSGEVSGETIFLYNQQGDIISAEYYGGKIINGSLVGKYTDKNQIEFSYQHVNHLGEIRTGMCISKIELLQDGRIRLNEKWRWTDGDRSEGTSVLEEVYK